MKPCIVIFRPRDVLYYSPARHIGSPMPHHACGSNGDFCGSAGSAVDPSLAIPFCHAKPLDHPRSRRFIFRRKAGEGQSVVCCERDRGDIRYICNTLLATTLAELYQEVRVHWVFLCFSLQRRWLLGEHCLMLITRPTFHCVRRCQVVIPAS
ncbi:hypothetical protein K461DRAFT_95224 [Myriangium duriaei CBS 260.36]|uniref:Uncharacterized protein n=1 Tax=Myriangium duriaei CBS 260.36 TaxID=1168546 RepID=A0A9P4MIV5_9PEZI|nr:hypothetical protein K461DRAFT_95224 [Myriangium duriaei CBS 260.36]